MNFMFMKEYKPKKSCIYKYGDKIQVIKQIERGAKYYSGVTGRYVSAHSEHVNYQGKCGIIAEIFNGGEYYYIQFGEYVSKEYWVESMFEPINKKFNSLLEEEN